MIPNVPLYELSQYYIELGIKIGIFVTIFSTVFGLFSLVVASYCVYVATLSRNKEGKWGRTPSCDEPDYLEMDDIGMAWHKKNLHFMEPVHIVNEGLNLYGEYYDFCNDQCVIILPGRTDSLRYSYYFAQPYMEQGYNVLVIDPRAHGESDGVYNTVGFGESRDVIAWATLLHEHYGIKRIILHGICIGAAAGALAITADNCPAYIDGLVVEGMYANFNEILRAHLIEKKKPRFLVLPLVNMWMQKYTNCTTMYGPIDIVGKMEKPILMMHSREDIFSLPSFAEKMYNECASENKQMVWFDTGRHSMLRITHTEAYDEAIKGFLTKNFQRQKVG